MDSKLDRAIEALRDTGSQGSTNDVLSDAARAEIVQMAWQEATDRAVSIRPVFSPLRWLAALGVVPVVLVVVLSMIPPKVGRGPEFVGAAKIDGEVVFTIADGRGSHRVVKSTDAARFNRAGAQKVTDGRYLDRANSGPVVVFYRID